jgi:hypothetical protein
MFNLDIQGDCQFYGTFVITFKTAWRYPDKSSVELNWSLEQENIQSSATHIFILYIYIIVVRCYC